MYVILNSKGLESVIYFSEMQQHISFIFFSCFIITTIIIIIIQERDIDREALPNRCRPTEMRA